MTNKKNKAKAKMSAVESDKQQHFQPAITASTDQEHKSFYAFIKSNHSLCFCIVIFAIITLLGFYLYQSNRNLKTAQQEIVKVYDDIQKQTTNSIVFYINQSAEHRNSLQSCVDRQINCLSKMLSSKDSLRGEDIFIKLYTDVEYMRGQNEYITKLATDSLSLQYRELASTVTAEKMLELHLDKIEHEYTNITIWAAVLTIVFLVFSFFSLFKIEQSRKEIEDLKRQGEADINAIITNASGIIKDSTSRLENLDKTVQPYKDEFESLVKEYRSIITAIKESKDE